MRLQDVITDFMNDSGSSVGFFGTVSFPKESYSSRKAIRSELFVSLPSSSASISFENGDGKGIVESLEDIVYVDGGSFEDGSFPSKIRSYRNHSNAL